MQSFAVAFSADGKLLVASSAAFRLWHVERLLGRKVEFKPVTPEGGD